MLDNFIKLVIGDLDKKREYKKIMNRVNALPKDYRFAFKKIQKYMNIVGRADADIKIFMDTTMLWDLVDLFETSVAEGRLLSDVVGTDVDKFCDEFMNAYSIKSETLREKLNREIMEKFNKEGR